MAKLVLDDPSEPMPDPPSGVVLGEYLGGDLAKSVFNNQVILPYDALEKHIAVIGQTGVGKTSTVERIIDQLARQIDTAQFFFLDAAADLDFARSFCAAMEATDRTVRVFPRQRFNAWPQGDWRAVFSRIMKAIAFAETGAAKWYTDLSTVAFARACRMGGKPPRSSKELFERLDYDRLVAEYKRAELTGLEREHVKAAFVRMMALYERTGSSLDGDWSCGDVGAGYFGLDSLVLGESIGVIAYMLLTHIANYAKHEKDPERICVVIIDEFASLVSGMHNVAEFIEQVRKLGVYVIIVSQTVAGMGDDRQARRIMNSVGTVIAHSTPEWKALSDRLGIKLRPELTLQYEEDDGAEPDRLRQIETPAVKPEEMLSQELGRAWVLRGGMSTQVHAALPDTTGRKPFELPDQEELYLPLGLMEPGTDDVPEPDFLRPTPREGGFHRADFEIPRDLGLEDGTDKLPEPGEPDPTSDREPGSGDSRRARIEIPEEFESGDRSDDRPDGDGPPLDEEEEGEDPSRPDWL